MYKFVTHMCTKLKPFLRVICIIVLASQSLSDIAWVVGVRTGLHFCRPQSREMPDAPLSPHFASLFAAPSWLPPGAICPFRAFSLHQWWVGIPPHTPSAEPQSSRLRRSTYSPSPYLISPVSNTCLKLKGVWFRVVRSKWTLNNNRRKF